MEHNLTGYRREDGRVGIRNHVLILPTVICANTVVEAIVREFDDKVIGVTHPYGCTFDYVSNDEISETYVGFATNPNVAAVVLISLGCETIDFAKVFERINAINPRAKRVVIQQVGGVQKAINEARAAVEALLPELDKMKPEPIDWSELIIGTQCGASDGYSGLTANPALGMAMDKVIAKGGSAILAELTEFIGAEDEILERCVDDETRATLQMYLDETERNLERVGSNELRDIAPGNIAGGLTTLEEKSLGCVKKGGTTPVVEVIAHATAPTKKGLLVMDTSGHDIESVVAIAAGGAQACFFTTGRGSPTGCPIMPVIKVSSNTPLSERMPDIIDVNAGTILEDKATLDDVSNEMIDTLVKVIAGTQTKSEINRCREFAIRRRGVDVCIL